MSASALLMQQSTAALRGRGLDNPVAVCDEKGDGDLSLHTSTSQELNDRGFDDGLCIVGCQVVNAGMYTEASTTRLALASHLAENGSCATLKQDGQRKVQSLANSYVLNGSTNGLNGESYAFAEVGKYMKLSNDKLKKQAVSVESDPVITAAISDLPQDMTTGEVLPAGRYDDLVITKQMHNKVKRITSIFDGQESNACCRIYKEEASIVFKQAKTSPKIGDSEPGKRVHTGQADVESVDRSTTSLTRSSDAELAYKNISGIPAAAADLLPEHDCLEEMHSSVEPLLRHCVQASGGPLGNQATGSVTPTSDDTNRTHGGDLTNSVAEDQTPVEVVLRSEIEDQTRVDRNGAKETLSDNDEGCLQGASTRTSVALLALCVAVIAIAMSNPWSANLSSGILAATLFFSLNTPSPGPPADSEKEDGHRHHQHQQHQQEEEKQKVEEDRAQQDRCVEVYPETVRQRQRNMMASSGKVDIKNWNSSGNNNNNESQMSPAKVKKFLPSVKALRNQFEAGKTNNRSESNGGVTNTGNGTLSHRSSGSTSSLASSTLEKTSSTNSLNSASDSMENLLSPSFENQRQVDPEEPVEPIFNQFKKVDEELKDLMSRPPSTTGWNPRPLLKRLYYTPEVPKIQSQGTTYINIEGFLEKLPSGRKKATFWNAWKRRYFVAKDGVLYYYQNTQAEKPSMKMTLMGGKVECMEPNMIGVDDGKGHYVVVRCSSRQEAERWRRALETHTVEDFASQYVQPWPMPTSPALLRDTLVIDLGSASVRAGVLASQATLPQVFLPSVVATERETRRQVWGFDALAPDVRAASSVSFPIRPSHKITKYSVDLSAISSLLQKTFADLKVDPKNYHIQLSVPRVLNNNTQTELLRVLFDKFGVRSVNLTHQSILALYAYNATSGIVVDIGERMDIVPVIDGYIVDGGVSRVPYGGYRILDHLRQFLYMRNVSLINEVESYIIRHVLENICYCAHHYNTEKARCTNNPDLYEKDVSLAEYFHTKDCPFETISLDFGRFQATEGLFNPDAWGLDHPGLHKLVHKAIMECSMDIRKEMSRSIFLAGGVTQLPGLVDRLTTEIDNLTPPAIRPKVHASPYRYHAAYIGACVLAESPAFVQSRISREDWNKHGNAALRKWSL